MSTQGNGGILSKFQQRLRNIRLSRSKKKKKNEEFIQEKVVEIRETLRRDATPIYKTKRDKGVVVSQKEVFKEKQKGTVSQVVVDIRSYPKKNTYRRKKVGIADKSQNKTIKDDFFKQQEVSQEKVVSFQGRVKKKQGEEVKEFNKDSSKNESRRVRYGYVSNVDRRKVRVGTDIEKQEFLENLGAEILDKIKGSFEEKLDQLAVLESELFFLEKSQENELELKKVKEIRTRIQALIEQVNNIIEQYNLYKKSYYIDNITDIDDNVLVDDIIQYRTLLDSLDLEKKFIKEYKALEEFNRLYNNLKAVRDDTEKLVQSNEQKIEELDIRDKKYNDVKMGMISVAEIDKKCAYEIEKQNEYFVSLMEKIDVINKEEYVTTHLRGIGDLVSSSLNYIGLMMLSPLSGLIPSIAVQTRATRKMIGNIYRRLHFEDVKHVRYSAINYDSELNHHLCSIDYTSDLLERTLDDIKKLKEDFLMQYDSRISGYEETLKNINKIEKTILRNQNRVEIVRKNLKKSKKINENKLKRVRALDAA